MTRLAAFRAIGAVTFFTLMIGCAGPPSAEQSSSRSASHSLPAAATSPSIPSSPPEMAPESAPASDPPSTATSSPSTAPAPLRIDGLALVVADGLRVRAAPGVVASELPGSFATGRRLFVLDGPVTDSGYDWYQVAPIAEGEDHGDAWDPTWHDGVSFHPEFRYRGIDEPIGWAASASRDGTPWIVGLRFDCPDPDVYFDLGISPLVALSCYGDKALQLRLSGGFTAADARLESYVGAPGMPSWLMDRGLRRYWFATGIIDPGEFFGTALDPGRFPNGFPRINSYEWKVVGHFDDQSASTCRADSGFADHDEPWVTVLMCRASFIVTDLAPDAG
jgi:hypothetical protein